MEVLLILGVTWLGVGLVVAPALCRRIASEDRSFSPADWISARRSLEGRRRRAAHFASTQAASSR